MHSKSGSAWHGAQASTCQPRVNPQDSKGIRRASPTEKGKRPKARNVTGGKCIRKSKGIQGITMTQFVRRMLLAMVPPIQKHWAMNA